MDKRYEVEISGQGSEVKKDMYVVCSCSHMTSFSVLMEVADSEVSNTCSILYTFDILKCVTSPNHCYTKYINLKLIS